jgi:hypothetical protein
MRPRLTRWTGIAGVLFFGALAAAIFQEQNAPEPLLVISFIGLAGVGPWSLITAILFTKRSQPGRSLH